MKKVLLVTIMIFSVVILSGCFHEEKKEQEEIGQKQEVTSMDEVKEEMVDEMGSAMKMIQSGKKVKCEYVVNGQAGETKMTTFVEGKKYRSQMAFGEFETNSIFDGEVVYTWNKGSENGTKMNLECQKELGGELAMEESQDAMEMSESVEDVFEGAFDVSCEEVSQIDFSVPGNVSFADQCELLKQQREMIKKMQQGQMPQINY